MKMPDLEYFDQGRWHPANMSKVDADWRESGYSTEPHAVRTWGRLLDGLEVTSRCGTQQFRVKR